MRVSGIGGARGLRIVLLCLALRDYVVAHIVVVVAVAAFDDTVVDVVAGDAVFCAGDAFVAGAVVGGDTVVDAVVVDAVAVAGDAVAGDAVAFAGAVVGGDTAVGVVVGWGGADRGAWCTAHSDPAP